MGSKPKLVLFSILPLASVVVCLMQYGGRVRSSNLNAIDIVEILPLPPVPPRIFEGEDYENCMEMMRTDPVGANAYADAWEATGGGEQAIHCRGLALIAVGDPKSGAALLERLGHDSKTPAVARARVYTQAEQAWLSAGDAARALADATIALNLSSDDPDTLIDRATAAVTLRRWDSAVDDLSRALEIDERRPDALVLRGTCWRQMGRLDLALDDVNRAFTLDAENPEALLERGILRQRQGDRTGAHNDWMEAIALAPDTPTSDLAEQNLALLEAGPERR